MKPAPRLGYRGSFAALGALLLAVSAPSAAQEGTRPKEAVAAVEPRALVLPVVGLTQETFAPLRDELKALTTQLFLCAPCKLEQPKEGACPKCKAALKAETRALFTAIELAPEDARLALTIDARVSVSLARIEGTLTKRGLKLEEDAFTLPGPVQLVVRAPQGLDPAAVQAALEDAKLFAAVKVEADPASSQLLVQARAGKQAPTRAKVVAALQETKAQLVDVVFVPPPPRS